MEQGAATEDEPATTAEATNATSGPEAAAQTEQRGRGGLDVYFSLCLLLATAVGLVFIQTRRFGFVWDDIINVAGNPHYNPVTPETFPFFWKNSYLALYVPLTYTFLGWEASLAIQPTETPKLYRFDPMVFHTGNLVLHILCVLLVYTLLRSLVRGEAGPFFGALFFGLHPLQVETVAWITETKGLLATNFALLALWRYIAFARFEPIANRVPATTWLNLAAATLAYVLALLSKPSAMVVPFVAAILQIGLIGWPRRRHWIALGVWLVPTALIGFITSNVQTGADPLAEVAPPWYRPFLVGFTVAFYLYKLVLPMGLHVDYGWTPFKVMAWGWSYGAWVIPVALAAVLSRLPERRAWLTALAVMVAGLLPVLGLVPFVFQSTSTVADRYMYLPMLGPALAVAWLVGTWPSPAMTVAATGLAALLGTTSFYQAQHWRDQRSLFERALAVNPKSRHGHHNLAQLHITKGEVKTALEHLGEVVKEHPRAWSSHADMAIAYGEMGQFADAERHARASLEVVPKNHQIRTLLGIALAQQNRLADARAEFEAVLAEDPDNARALDGLGDILTRQGRPADGIEKIKKALSLMPDDARAEEHLGQALARRGDAKGAVEHWRRAMALDPKRLPGAIDLAWQRATNPDPALRDGSEALRLAIQVRDTLGLVNVQVLDTLAAAHAELGEFDQAEKVGLQALALATAEKDIEKQYRIKVRLVFYKQKRPYHQEQENVRTRPPAEAPR